LLSAAERNYGKLALSTENPVTVQVVVVSKCFLSNTLLAILHLEIAKNLFAAGSAEQLNSPQLYFNEIYVERK